MLLGALTKQMHLTKMLLPRPEVPFFRLGIKDVCNQMLSLGSTYWCQDDGQQHSCDLVMIVPDIINDLMASTKGLTLSGEGMTEGG
jgi:hypothetical protein